MNFPKVGNSLFIMLSTTILAILLVGCAQTTAPAPDVTQSTAGQTPSSPASTAPQRSSQFSMQSEQAPSGNQTQGQFESAAVVNASDLLPTSALSGPGFRVQQQVPTNGAMGQYTIVLDSSVYQNSAGTYQVESLDMLKIRLSELPAIAKLDQMSQTGVFAKALAASAERPVEDAAQMVTHPMDTVTGLPSGVGEFFGRVNLGAKTVYATATNSSETGEERASETAEETGGITLTALGYDQDRRNLARKLHVDPYTTNPILKQKLNQTAWAMFSARMTVDAVLDVAVPGSMIITGTEVTDDLVYQTPKADLIMLVHKDLKKIGLSPEEITTFSSNPAIPLSLQVIVVRDLVSLGNIPGRHAVAVYLANVMTEYQARFLATSIWMLVQWGQQNSPITRISVQGVLLGHDQNGTVVMPAPVDYVSWTPRIAGFATDPAMVAAQNRVIWIPAGMTPMARQQLQANGWQVHEGAQP